jgi:hypothetical protein
MENELRMHSNPCFPHLAHSVSGPVSGCSPSACFSTCALWLRLLQPRIPNKALAFRRRGHGNGHGLVIRVSRSPAPLTLTVYWARTSIAQAPHPRTLLTTGVFPPYFGVGSCTAATPTTLSVSRRFTDGGQVSARHGVLPNAPPELTARI